LLRRPFEAAQYVSITYTRHLADAGIAPSVGSVGDRFDNALAETVIGLFKTELIRRLGPWRPLEAVEWATLALGLLLKAAAPLSDCFAAARNGSIGTTIDASSSPSATSHRPRPKPATTTTWRIPPWRRRN
jgi:transposase InsO family protein